MRKSMWVILGITCAVNIALWSLFNRPENPEPGWSGIFNYVSFSPYRDGQDPIESRFPAPEEIMEDLAFLKDKTKGIRTYSSLDGMEAIPGMATRLGFEVTAGAWIDGRYERNEDEIYNLIQNVNRYPATIKRVIVGNEALYRTDLTVEEIIDYLDRVLEAVKVPVGTAEPWHVFIKNPELTIVDMVVDEHESVQTIAQRLDKSESTNKRDLKEILQKVGVLTVLLVLCLSAALLPRQDIRSGDERPMAATVDDHPGESPHEQHAIPDTADQPSHGGAAATLQTPPEPWSKHMSPDKKSILGHGAQTLAWRCIVTPDESCSKPYYYRACLAEPKSVTEPECSLEPPFRGHDNVALCLLR